jgi:hypothetical protein
MSRLFESFEYLDRGWDVRVLENSSLRSVFLWLLILAFVLGMDAVVVAYQVAHFHRFNWSEALNIFVGCLLAVQYSRAFYRRLGQ